MSERDKTGDVAERIRKAREAAQLTPEELALRTPRQKGHPLTQVELARRMGITRENLNKIENGGSVGRLNAQRLAKALGGEPGDYLTQVRSDALDVAQRLLRRLEAGERLPRRDLLEAADAVDRAAALSARLAGELRAAAQGDRITH